MIDNKSYSVLFLSYLFTTITLCSSLNPSYEACQPATCGNQIITYPFYIEGRQRSFCGYPGFGLSCPYNGLPILHISNIQYIIHQISYKGRSIRVSEAAATSSSSNGTSSCVIPRTHNITLEGTRFSFALNQMDLLLLFGCNLGALPEYLGKYRVGCSEENETRSVLGMTVEGENLRSAFEECNGGVVKTKVDNNTDVNGEVLRRGFVLNWIVSDCSLCEETGGKCGFNSNVDVYSFRCHCPDRDHAVRCDPGAENSRRGRTNLIIGLTTGAVGTLLISVIIFRSKIKSLRQKTEFWKTSSWINQNIEAFIKDHGPLALTRYKFAEIKKMTNSFEVKLGQGGYGAVYKGKLLDGQLVAVKLLRLSKGNGEEFINELASISRTSHVNIVTLLGFCLEGHKKALIYEFMPNGSLDKFILNKMIGNADSSLTWENLFQIALGTARGLEYLHQGCNTRILHFDIKPHNILLDENFCPKISDFGLSKLCPRKESIFSISEAKGTVGYLAPEIWNRNIGGVSHKSDVYSYGMMLLDMVGGRNNMNDDINCTSTQNYFPDWIYGKLEQGSNLGISDGANIVEENDVAKRMTIVGLWCTQTFPTQRPTIGRVIEMLEGSLNSLEMPPKPVMWSSPPRSELESSSTSNTTT